MADYPLLPAPSPTETRRPPGPRRGRSDIRTPTLERQQERIGPVFDRLRSVLRSDRDPVILREDPAGIAPERAIVFEVAGSIADFNDAVRRIEGLSFLADEALEVAPDEDFAILDTRAAAAEGDTRDDRIIAGRLYAAMPDVRALRNLEGLWRRWQRGEAAPSGFGPWYSVFEQLHELRAWGPRDRVTDEAIAHFEEILEGRAPDEMVRLEIELWHVPGRLRREAMAARFAEALASAGGRVAHAASIDEIGYAGRLVDLPVSALRRITEREEVHLAVCDEIMLVRPQSNVSFEVAVEPLPPSIDARGEPVGAVPIAALLDGMPVQRHALLEDRLILDDPDDLDALSVVAERRHGTEMASLILHGDLAHGEPPLPRPIYVRPVLYAPGGGTRERPLEDRLLVDTVYRAVRRMKEGEGDDPPTAPAVFIVNLSLGDKSRPFSGPMSPWGRLIDHLAARYGILFLVSAGNVRSPLPVDGFQGLIDFEAASLEEREEKILDALAAAQAHRTLLSPAEALNAVTVGACHVDGAPIVETSTTLRPFVDGGAPNISSALGLGHRKVVKPDILMPGGRELVSVVGSGQGLMLRGAPGGRLFGLRCAAPDAGGQLDREGMSWGTSGATALASRAAHQIFDALLDPDNGDLLAGVDPIFYGVIVKALLVHRAGWSDVGAALDRRWPPRGQGSHVPRRDGIARLLGYGQPIVTEAVRCAANRATMIGYGAMPASERAAQYRIPLPPSLAGVREPRALTATLAWFSPVNMRHGGYRQAKLEVQPLDEQTRFGVKRVASQPSDKSVPRGSLFHVRYAGERAVAFVDGDEIALNVFCREQAGGLDGAVVRYGFAISIEAGEAVPVYAEIRQRLGLVVRT